jgi:CRISPR-associated endoribonuclease Cas6
MRIESSTIEWFIGMPVETTLQHLVIGMFEKREFFIEREENRFVIEQVETLPEPKWERTMKFRMLSPLTISIPRENGTFRSDGRPKLTAEYLVPDDPRLNEALRSNIVNKFSSLFGTPPSDTEFICTPDSKFLADQERKGKRVTRLVIIKQGRSDESQIRGFMCPLTIEGNPALIALAYESGLGEKNSLGFGMLEVEARQPSTLHEHR